ncbi:MAG: 3'-5' exonuclease [Verrucomicrobia bacterium]|nr:3'-5' exonuclease [Verrucomicrobiota bacterium]
MIGIFLDTETNGLSSRRHRVLEIAFRMLDILTGEEKDSYQAVLSLSEEEWQKSDPESLKINGFSWEEIQRGIPSAQVAEEIKLHFMRQGIRRGEAVFICQNPSFDRAFFSQLVEPELQESLLWPYHWLDLASMYWAIAMRKGAQGTGNYPWETGVSKDKIATTYQLPKESPPHRAMRGVDHLILCYRAVIGFPKAQ